MRTRRQTTQLLLSAFAVLFTLSLTTVFYGCGEDSGSPPARSSGVATTENAICGNSVVEVGEQCDDGNNVSGDGCSPSCATELGAKGQLAVEISETIITAGSATGATVTVTLTGVDIPEPVTLNVSDSSVAELKNTLLVLDGNGKATTTLFGLEAGAITIKVTHALLSVTSSTVYVTMPSITISSIETELGGSTIIASTPGMAGALITATVKDYYGNLFVPRKGEEVTFSTTLGTLTDTTVPEGEVGLFQATLTSTEAGSALVAASILGAETEASEIIVEPDSLATLTLTPDISLIKKIPAAKVLSTIKIIGSDLYGNPVDAAVDFVSTNPNAGTLDPTFVNLGVDGEATVYFTAGQDCQGTTSIIATVNGLEFSVDISVTNDEQGDPVYISMVVDPVDGKISVNGVGGGNEKAVITITVTDVDGANIVDIPGNLEVEIIEAPGSFGSDSRPMLEDEDAQTGVLHMTTTNGVATAYLKSGTQPGTVEIEARVTRKRDGSLFATPLTATAPKITIVEAQPFSISVYPTNSIMSPGLAGDGSLTHEYKAYVTDRYGNSPPDGTSVYFGAFTNILEECPSLKIPLCEVSIDATGKLTVLQGDFVNSKIAPGDTVVLFGIKGYGGYIVKSVESPTELMLETTLSPVAEGFSGYAVGNAGDAIFTTDQVGTVGGVAVWQLTYPGWLVNKKFYIHAETRGKTLGAALGGRFWWTAPTVINLLGGDQEVKVGTPATINLIVTDGSTPRPYEISDLPVKYSISGPVTSGLGGWVTTDQYGQASLTYTVKTVAEGAIIGDNIKITFSVGTDEATATATVVE